MFRVGSRGRHPKCQPKNERNLPKSEKTTKFSKDPGGFKARSCKVNYGPKMNFKMIFGFGRPESFHP